MPIIHAYGKTPEWVPARGRDKEYSCFVCYRQFDLVEKKSKPRLLEPYFTERKRETINAALGLLRTNIDFKLVKKVLKNYDMFCPYCSMPIQRKNLKK